MPPRHLALARSGCYMASGASPYHATAGPPTCSTSTMPCDSGQHAQHPVDHRQPREDVARAQGLVAVELEAPLLVALGHDVDLVDHASHPTRLRRRGVPGCLDLEFLRGPDRLPHAVAGLRATVSHTRLPGSA